MSTVDEAAILASILRRVQALELAIGGGGSVGGMLSTIDTNLTTLDGEVATLDGILAAFIAGFVEHDSYTPTLTNITLGTGGTPTNGAIYTYVGGTEVGDHGVIQISGRIQLGTTGEAVGTAPNWTLPPGFEAVVHTGNTANRVGIVTMSAGGVNSIGFVQVTSATNIGAVALNAGSTYVGGATPTASIPGTWGNDDTMTWNAWLQVVRV